MTNTKKKKKKKSQYIDTSQETKQEATQKVHQKYNLNPNTFKTILQYLLFIQLCASKMKCICPRRVIRYESVQKLPSYLQNEMKCIFVFFRTEREREKFVCLCISAHGLGPSVENGPFHLFTIWPCGLSQSNPNYCKLNFLFIQLHQLDFLSLFLFFNFKWGICKLEHMQSTFHPPKILYLLSIEIKISFIEGQKCTILITKTNYLLWEKKPTPEIDLTIKTSKCHFSLFIG